MAAYLATAPLMDRFPAPPTAPATGMGWFAVIFLSIFCTGLSFIVQSLAQQYTSSTHVGVIFCLEPVFAMFVAFFLAGEVLLPRGYVGAALMLAGLLLMEINLPFFAKAGSGGEDHRD